MSKLGINTGFSPNDGNGDTLLTGALKVNSNFTEIYSALGDNVNLLVGVGKTVLSIRTSGNVGIASTLPTSALDVIGDSKFTGIVTANSFAVGSTRFINNSLQLQNISSLDAVTTATIESAISVPPNTFTDLKISGIASFAQGPVLVGGGTTTGTTATVLQVSGINSSVYIGGNLGVGTINPTTPITISIPGSASNSQILLNGSTNNWIDFSQIGIATPAFTTRSSGTKIVLLNQLSVSNLDYALGVEPNSLWRSIPQASSTYSHKWYAGITTLATLKGSGELLLTGSNASVGIATTNPIATLHIQSTGTIAGLFSGATSSDMVRITQAGSGYALVVEDAVNPDPNPFIVNSDGSVGIGTTNTTSKLSVYGDTFVSGVVTATTFNGNVNIGVGTITNAIGTNLNYSGISTITTAFGTRIDYPQAFHNLGILTTASITTANINTGVVTAISGLNLSYTGVSTFTAAAGPVLIGGGSTTGTSGQILQVTGINSSVYIGGNVGIATINPLATLHVSGTIRDGIGTIRTIPQNAPGVAGTYVMASSDIGKHISVIGFGVTINANIFSTGDVFHIFNNTAGSIIVGNGTAVTLYLSGNANPSGIRTLASRTLSTILCVGTNTFVAGAAAGAASGGPIS
jgi:hypothetical protein